jgi:hypothetical protein
VTYLAPTCAQQNGEQDGPEDAELQPEIFNQLYRMNERGLPADIGAGVLDGGKAVLGVPDEERREQGEGKKHHDE